MMRQQFVRWLREHVPHERWEQMWWLAPAGTLLLLPLGAPLLQVLAWLGWHGAPRATQSLMLLAILGGVVVGGLVLWSVEEAGLDSAILNRARWMGRFAVIGPLLTLLIIFGIAKVT